MNMTIAEEILFYYTHNPQEGLLEASKEALYTDVLSAANSGMYSAILTFNDRSRLYLEEDKLYIVSLDSEGHE